ncbi:hypothetical protein D9758_004326 [Tetrapyrgos nigripes]|uniref:Cytochrome P450 n=1 Tax=Tetrapyrgos nigripes TaxID=182062 RepID=A0A8H5LS13_9AGAR|nr:hypothetical protein D9758_004326 [Tetrapyrgos nigripes]
MFIMGQPGIILNSFKPAKELLDGKSGIYSDRPIIPMGGELVGWKNSLSLLPYSDRFKRYRRLAKQLFGSPKTMEAFHPVEQLETHRFLKSLLAQPDRFVQHIQKTAGAIILHVTHGYAVQDGEDPFVTLADTAMEQFSQSVSSTGFMVNLIPALQYIPEWFPGAGFQRIAKEWASTLEAMVDQPYQWVKSRVAEGTAELSFISEMLSEKLKLDGEEEFEIKWSAASLYAGGADTTVATMIAFFKAMLLYPEVAQKAQAEIDRVIGSDRLPTFADRQHLPYVNALALETLRWHTVAPTAIPHRLMADDIYNGYFIPKGSLVIANVWQMSHDPAVYPDPMVFRPERFLPIDGSKPQMDPRELCFGFGRRICPGRVLADASVFISCAMVLAAFDVSPYLNEGIPDAPPAVEQKAGTVRQVSHSELVHVKAINNFESAGRAIYRETANVIRRYQPQFPTMSSVTPVDVLFIALAVWLLSKLISRVRRERRLTPLKGPPRKSLIFGVLKYLNQAPDSGAVYEEWVTKYGSVYQIPTVLGSKRVVLTDPKAVAHFYAKETVTNGILVAEGSSHKRQRKALTPAFSNIAIRRLTSVFYDSAYKLKATWDSMIESNSDGKVIDVQMWMNRISLDSIGIAGFSHDFNSLAGQASSISDLFDTFAGLKPPPQTLLSRILTPIALILFLLGTIFPPILHVPTQRTKMSQQLRRDTSEIADILLEKTRKEKELGLVDEQGDKSVIGLLSRRPNLFIEVVERGDFSAGYETTSISLTWALIELCIQPHIQDKLREELSRTGTDLTWEQLNTTTDFPYLDAVVHETLRMHPPLSETTRTANTDDVMPLSSPLQPSGNSSKSFVVGETAGIAIPKGTVITVPIRCINRSEAFWGPDAKQFKPERWIEGEEGASGIPEAAREVSGHRHLLTFSDGPRICLGKGFALAEFKAVLSVLIRNYTFEFPEGKDIIPKIEIHRSILPRPKIEGQKGARVPLRVRRV